MSGPSRQGRRPQPRRTPRGSRPGRVPAASLPVARVSVDVPLAHLDRPFDYLVPAALAAEAVPGCRVRVRFSGRLVGGYLLERAAASDHQRGLAFLERVVSAEPVLTPEIAGLARAVADRYAGTLADVLRLAIPPRHAAVESGPRHPVAEPGPRHPAAEPSQGPPGVPQGVTGRSREAGPGREDCPGAQPGPWARYPAGASFLAALARGAAPRAVWAALPGPDWPEEIARAAAATAASGRGTVIVVPDARDLQLVDAALAEVLGAGRHVILAAGLGPAERYRRWLAVARGEVTVTAGTRSAMFAPVANLGLACIWDDGDDLHAEPRAPYPHAREVLALRAQRAEAALLIGGFARTAEAAQILAGGWARPLAADRATVRRCAPLITAAGDDDELARDQAARSARLPSLALRTASEALARGPVLFQVPRRGYVAALSCERCRAPARCGRCSGPVALAGAGSPPRCGWCGSAASGTCARCGHHGLRALVTGSGRTAEELGRAFPSVPVRTSGGARVMARVPASPAVVVATPGAEPQADGGYAAAVLLDGWALLGRASLGAAQETLRRWLNAAALTRPAADGGAVIVIADAGLAVVQALVRWDPARHAERELAERRELRFPPAARIASLTGTEGALNDLVTAAALPASAEVLGPVPAAGGARPGRGEPDPDVVQILVRVPRSAGADLAAGLQAALRARSARKEAGQVRLQLDPAELI